MRLNKKGFVSTAVLYSLLLLFLALILGLLALLSNRKQILDKLKGDIKSEVNQTKNYDVYENGETIYYNPVTGKVCYDYTEANSKTGITEGCLKWYIFNDDKNKATVNMILDHNTTATVAWASLEDYIEAGGTEEEYGENGNNDRGPLTVTKRLNEDTENWKNKARLISADEIAKITGANLDTTIKWSSNKTNGTDDIETKSAWFYFDGSGTSYSTTDGWQKQVANETTKSKYAWLYNNTNGCTRYGCNIEDSSTYGYWTTTSVYNNNNSWDVTYAGRLYDYNVASDGSGVRPVITISKKEIKYDSFEITYDYTGSEQSFTVPISGNYKIELWGASGGNALSNSTLTNGTGGYTSGIISLDKNNQLYVYIGGVGRRYNTSTSGGYNGGGNSSQSTSGAIGETGGGATDIRLVNGTWNNFDSLKSRIMVAAGGGGTAGYNLSSVAGGLNGYDGVSVSDYNTYLGKGASQISGGAAPTMFVSAQSNGTTGGFGYGGTGGASGSSSVSGGGSGAGGGYYGGSGASGLSNGTFPAGGGSSFISGHDGCDAIASTSTEGNITHTSQSKHYSGLYFTNTSIIDGLGYNWTTQKGEYVGMPTHDGTDTMTGNIGNGYAKITYLGNE